MKNCINCGNESCYAKGMCRSCYNKFLRSGFVDVNDFINLNRSINDLKEKRDKIESLSSILKFTYADIGNICGVSREMARRWFKNKYIPDKYVDIIFEYFNNIADHAYCTLSSLKHS